MIPELSVVMPAYNEEEVIRRSIDEARAALDRICKDWELVIVDDGSSDATPKIVEEASLEDPRVRLVRHEVNRGYSKALATGFASCKKALLFYTDADCQFDLMEIEKLYPHVGEHHMVAGYRVGRQDPAVRLLTSFVYNMLQALVLGVWVRDVNCAFKMFRKEFFDKVQITSEGFLVDAELYARAKAAGFSWKQVPVRHRPRPGGSTTVKAGTVLETLRELWRLRRRLWKEARSG